MPLSTFVARLIWLCMLPLLLLAAWLAVDSVRTSQSDRDLEAVNLAKNFATTIDHELNARIAALNVLAVSPLVDDASRWKDLYREAQGFYQSLGSHVILADVGTPMHMLFNTRVPFGTELPMLPQPKGRAAAPTALETGKPAVGDTFFGPIAREPLVAIAVPAMREGRAAFLLLTIFETRQFQKHLDQMVLPSGWSLALLDGSGETIARRTRPGLNPEKDGDGAARFVVESTVSPWSVGLEIPPDVYRAPLLTAVAAMGAGILGATLASFLGGMLAGRRLGRSVASLAETPAPGAPLPDILEVAAARRLLDEAAERRARAEATLRVSEEKLRLFIEHAPVAIAMFDREMRYLAASRRWMADYHLGNRDMVGRSHYEITPEIPDRWKEAHRQGLEGAVVQTDEDAFVRSDGTVQWLRWVVRPWYTADGAVGGIVIFTEDITERKRSETAIQESRDRYRALFENMLNGFAYCKMLLDDQGRPVDFVYLDVNQAFTRLTGLKNVVGRKVSDVIPGIRELSPELFEIYGRVALTGKPEAFEIYLKPLEIWLSISAYSLHREDFIAVFDNITERKRDEEALRVSHRFLEIVHDKREMTPLLEAFMSEIRAYTGCEAVGIRVLDEEGRIPYRAYTGFSQDFFNLESPLSIKSDQCMCINVIRGAVDPGLPFYTQGASFYMNGTTRFLATVSEEDKGQTRNRCNYEGYESVALVPFRDGDRILGLIHVADRREGMVPLGVVELLEKAALQLGTSIKRVRAEQELRESQERYRFVADYTYDWEYWVDSAGKFLYVSPSCERVSGYPPSFFLDDPQALFNIIHPEDRYKFESHMNDLGTCSSKPGGIEFRIITQTGEARWIDHKCWAVFSKKGNYMGRRGSNRDITQRLQLENQFRQSQKMEAVGRLAGGVAHDFNNMLGVIIGYTELASMKLPADDPLQMYLDEVKSAAQRSADITRQLLAFARKQTIDPKVLDLNDTIASMLKMLRRLIGEDIDLLWKPAKDLWPVKMDPAQIDQILANLMVNARDAIAGVGKITIETGKVEFDADYCQAHAGFIPGKYIMLAVSDDGCGMDKKTLVQLFEPFFTTKEVGKGTGLGLATIYGIVKQNNGFINVYSEPGIGTTFKIYLPRQEPQAAAAEQPHKPAEIPTGTETVLLVEDERSLLKFAGMLLEELGYTVLAAGSPREAIRLAKEYTNEIHLLVTDVVMPEMSGRDLWEQIKASQPGLRCFFMSGYPANVIAHHGVLDEGVHFLQKPFSREAFATKIREALI
ncbi:MAG: PAS domain S-box protein [Deltaproteobacteria bacterium]|nr:PAS domain S-box protein [Deltaproteobacteria bacterium]